MNKKGQALIEFILILPVFLLLIFSLFDFGRIILCKNHLEGVMSNVVKLDENEVNNYLKNDEYKIIYNKNNNKIILKVKLDLITPGLKSILHNPYDVIVERSVINE